MPLNKSNIDSVVTNMKFFPQVTCDLLEPNF